jgi:hypothetical protein
MSNPEKESKARQLLADAQRNAIEAKRLLDGHAARIFADKAIKNLDEGLEWLKEKEAK